jgi:hypothetical protein
MAYGDKDRTTNDGRDTKERKHRAFTFPVSGEEGASERGDKLDGTERNVEQDCVERVIAEGLDDQGAEGGDAAARNPRLRMLVGHPESVYALVRIEKDARD